MSTSTSARASYAGDEVYPLMIGGREEAAAESFACIDPSTGEAWTRMAEATADDVGRAVEAARAAFGEWRATSPATRQSTLERIATVIEEDPGWPSLLATENGRPIREARIADVPTTVDVFRYFAGLARGLEGATVPTGNPDRLVWTDARAAGSDRGPHPLELPSHLHGAEGRSRARRGQHDRAQAVRAGLRERRRVRAPRRRTSCPTGSSTW